MKHTINLIIYLLFKVVQHLFIYGCLWYAMQSAFIRLFPHLRLWVSGILAFIALFFTVRVLYHDYSVTEKEETLNGFDDSYEGY